MCLSLRRGYEHRQEARMWVRPVDLGDRVLLLGTERGVEPPIAISSDDYKLLKDKDLDCFIGRGRVGEGPLGEH